MSQVGWFGSFFLDLTTLPAEGLLAGPATLKAGSEGDLASSRFELSAQTHKRTLSWFSLSLLWPPVTIRWWVAPGEAHWVERTCQILETPISQFAYDFQVAKLLIETSCDLQISSKVRYVHTKILLIDMFSDEPIAWSPVADKSLLHVQTLCVLLHRRSSLVGVLAVNQSNKEASQRFGLHMRLGQLLEGLYGIQWRTPMACWIHILNH